jgi:LysM repeat protein
MIMKRFFLIFIIAIIAIGSSGCKLPASTAPATATTGTGGFPVPGGEGTETMGLFERIATQTALAAAGGGQNPAVTTNTPEPQAATPAGGGESGGGQVQQPTKPSAPKPTKTARPVVVVPTATAGLPANYTLQKGEFPFCIARRFNVNPSELLSLNGLNNNSATSPGLKLKIPQTGNTFPGTRALVKHPATYTVKSGDTIYSIACYYGDLDPSSIAIANSLKSPYKVTAGQTLEIP